MHLFCWDSAQNAIWIWIWMWMWMWMWMYLHMDVDLGPMAPMRFCSESPKIPPNTRILLEIPQNPLQYSHPAASSKQPAGLLIHIFC